MKGREEASGRVRAGGQSASDPRGNGTGNAGSAPENEAESAPRHAESGEIGSESPDREAQYALTRTEPAREGEPNARKSSGIAVVGPEPVPDNALGIAPDAEVAETGPRRGGPGFENPTEKACGRPAGTDGNDGAVDAEPQVSRAAVPREAVLKENPKSYEGDAAARRDPKRRRALKRAAGALGAAAFLFVAVCFLVILVQLFSGKEPNLFGYRFYYILTDSMTPTYEPHDVVLSKGFPDEASRLDIEVGDVVTFLGNTGDQNGKIITHRVVKAPYFDADSGKYFLVTKGDKAGAPEDAPIPLENVRAAAIGKSRFVGFLYRAIRTPVGYVFLIVVPVCLLIALLILKLVFDFSKKKKADAAEAERARIERLKAEAVEQYRKEREKEE